MKVLKLDSPILEVGISNLYQCIGTEILPGTGKTQKVVVNSKGILPKMALIHVNKLHRYLPSKASSSPSKIGFPDR